MECYVLTFLIVSLAIIGLITVFKKVIFFLLELEEKYGSMKAAIAFVGFIFVIALMFLCAFIGVNNASF